MKNTQRLSFNSRPSRWTWVSLFTHDFPSPYIVFNTIPPCPSQKRRQWKKTSRGKVHSMRGKWYRVFVTGRRSCRQPVLKDLILSSTTNRLLREGKAVNEEWDNNINISSTSSNYNVLTLNHLTCRQVHRTVPRTTLQIQLKTEQSDITRWTSIILRHQSGVLVQWLGS